MYFKGKSKVIRVGKQGFSQVDRLARLANVYLFQKGTIKKAWSHEGIVNETRCKGTDIMLGYFLDFSNDAYYQGPFDSKGVPLIDYTGRIGIQYNPWYIGHYALAQFEKYRTSNNSTHLEKFLVQAEWFTNKAVDREGGQFAVWEYTFSWSSNLKAPWISSLSQSYGLSVLLRAYDITQTSNHMRLAEKVFKSFTMSIDQGGVLNNDNRLTVFEESPVRPVDTVLNGYIFSIFGILEYAQFTGDDRAYDLYYKSIESLEKLLPMFDLSFWSKYSTRQRRFFPPIASMFYHRVHINQLKALFLITGNKVFAEYAKRWEDYSKSIIKRLLAVAIKMGYKLFNN